MRNRDFLKGKEFYVVTFLIALLILQPQHLCGQGVREVPKGTTMEIKENRITVNLQKAELSEFLKEIGAGTGIKITIPKELVGKKVTEFFVDSDVESALKTLLSDYPYIFTYT